MLEYENADVLCSSGDGGMDKLKLAYYEVAFERDYLKKGGNEFQDFFSEIMEKCHPGKFLRVCPWGRVGDEKNDGYLWSMRTLFQVYAPNEMTANEATAKIHRDFYGALPHWQEYFDTWILVHNSRRGLGPQITKKLLELGTCQKDVTIAPPWGFEELRQNVFSLNEMDIASLLGSAPSSRDMLDVRYENVQEVLSHIAKQEPPLLEDIPPVPSDKIKRNHLSIDVQNLLTAGLQKTTLVGKFFDEHFNPSYGDEIAVAFRKEYAKYRTLQMDPDTIFRKLQEFTGGVERGSPTDQAAVLVVLAYLFEQCEIFERSPVEVVT